MPDRIFITFEETLAPEAYHTAINYVRTDLGGNVIQHEILDAGPSKRLNVLEKALGAAAEMSPGNFGPSIFGNIQARVRHPDPKEGKLPYEMIAEEDDLSENWRKSHDFAADFNDRGYEYRALGQNSNTFAGEALRAGGLPPARGVGTDPTDKPGNRYEFFSPGLYVPLRPPADADMNRR